jgi:hypothetical protein
VREGESEGARESGVGLEGGQRERERERENERERSLSICMPLVERRERDHYRHASLLWTFARGLGLSA